MLILGVVLLVLGGLSCLASLLCVFVKRRALGTFLANVSVGLSMAAAIILLALP